MKGSESFCFFLLFFCFFVLREINLSIIFKKQTNFCMSFSSASLTFLKRREFLSGITSLLLSFGNVQISNGYVVGITVT